MLYTVVWSRDAINKLAFLWTHSLQRAYVNQMTQVIEKELKYDAQNKGTELPEGLRRLEYEKLTVTFTVSVDDRLVRVVGLGKHPDLL